MQEAVKCEASNIAHSYTVCFHKEGVTCGSGVLVQYKSLRGILTAWHVPNNPKNAELRFNKSGIEVGLVLKNSPHDFLISTSSLIEIGKPESEEWGPDLIFLKLHESDVSKISAFKSFYNLGINTIQKLNHSLSDLGLFVACGYPRKLVLDLSGDLNFKKLQLVPAIGGVTLREAYAERDGYDVIDVAYEWATNPDVPPVAKGISGGGIWRFDLKKNSNGEFILKENEYSLAGISFYQSPEVNSTCIIRGMGGISIYKNTVNK